MESVEEFARRIERQAGDCECAECMRPLIEGRDNATRLALLAEIRADANRYAVSIGSAFLLIETKYRAGGQ